MPTEELVIGVFCMLDAELGPVKKHSQAKLHPSEVIILMLLFAMKGGHYRAFYRWILYNYRCLFPNAPPLFTIITLISEPCPFL